jgi:hypothetical protein
VGVRKKESRKEDRNGSSGQQQRQVYIGMNMGGLQSRRDQSAFSNRLGIYGAVQGVFGRWSSGQVCGGHG